MLTAARTAVISQGKLARHLSQQLPKKGALPISNLSRNPLRRLFVDHGGTTGMINMAESKPGPNQVPSHVAKALEHCVETSPGYTPPPGDPSCLKRCVEGLKTIGIHTDVRKAHMTTGSSNGISTALQRLLYKQPRRPVFVESLGFEPHNGMVEISGGEPRPFDPNDIATTYERVMAEKPAAIIFSSPNNPTSRVMNPKRIYQLAEICRKNDVFLIHDGTYAAHDPNFVPATSFFDDSDQNVLGAVVSTTAAKLPTGAGHRTGVNIYSNPVVRDGVCNLIGYAAPCPSLTSQKSGAIIYENIRILGYIAREVAHENRAKLIEIGQTKQLAFHRADTGPYSLLDTKGKPGIDVHTEALQKGVLTVHMGLCNGDPNFPALRLSGGLGEAQIDRGLGILANIINR